MHPRVLLVIYRSTQNSSRISVALYATASRSTQGNTEARYVRLFEITLHRQLENGQRGNPGAISESDLVQDVPLAKVSGSPTAARSLPPFSSFLSSRLSSEAA
ncbi:hypothetical protein KM043_013519 [Ampulex compressa]|nr:hypothetical protein KM043_013519 [Ampulex compressa]